MFLQGSHAGDLMRRRRGENPTFDSNLPTNIYNTIVSLLSLRVIYTDQAGELESPPSLLHSLLAVPVLGWHLNHSPDFVSPGHSAGLHWTSEIALNMFSFNES